MDSHRREDDMPMEQHLHARAAGRRPMFPSLNNLNLELWSAILSLVVVLLPGLVIKLSAYSQSTAGEAPSMTANLAQSVGFSNSTLIIGFILALFALSRSKNDASIRTIAILTMIVCIIRLVLTA